MDDEQEHGPEQCFYTWVGPGEMWPHLVCLCGFTAYGPNWEEAGEAMDGHLEEANDPSNPRAARD